MFLYEEMINHASLRGDEYWASEFLRLRSLWIHNGDPTAPHALLASGKHSGGFFNASKIVGEHPRLAFEAVACLCGGIIKNVDGFSKLNWIFGSANGATCIANNIGTFLNKSAGFTERLGVGRFESMEVNKRFNIKKDDDVLMVDDVLITGGKTLKSIDALERKGATVLPFIIVLVNRSGMISLEGRKIISLIDKEMPIWEPDECSLCEQGSEAVRPKENWNKLVGVAAG